MSSVRLYTFYDTKTESWGLPMSCDSRGDAERLFIRIVNDIENKENQIAQYPDDFTFFEVGLYDRHSGKFVIYEAPISFGVAMTYRKGSNGSLVPNSETVLNGVNSEFLANNKE